MHALGIEPLPPAMVYASHSEMSPLGEDGIAIGAARHAIPHVR